METETVNTEIDQNNENQYLTFSLGGESYGVPIFSIREVINYHSISPVPLSCDTVRGVMNLRGNVVTVIDLSARLYGRKKADGKKGVIIIAEAEDEGEQLQIGMLIDGVNAVIDLAEEEIEPEPDFGAKIRSDFIARIGKHDGQFIIILDLSRILELDELSECNAMEIRPEGAGM
ncbi:MAG: chemotaxis protein CheW [Spirochaetota bacterium]